MAVTANGESSVDREEVREDAYEEGREDGRKTGRRAADENSFDELIREFDDGAKTVMGGYDEDWQPGSWYIVRISKKYPRGFVGSWINYRQPLSEGLAYSTCGEANDEICYSEE